MSLRFLLWVSFSLLAFGQQSTGVITGLVTDSQDAAVPAAKVEVFHVETGATFRTESNGQGVYNAPGMAVGRYEVRAERAGFKRAVRSGITRILLAVIKPCAFIIVLKTV